MPVDYFGVFLAFAIWIVGLVLITRHFMQTRLEGKMDRAVGYILIWTIACPMLLIAYYWNSIASQL